MNPFKAIKNYSEMLVKIAAYTFFVTLFLVIIIRTNHEGINDFLIKLEPDFKVKLFDVEQSVMTLIIPFILAFLSNSLKLHDKISTLFKIRYNFDSKYILVVICEKLNITYDINKLKNNRKKLMRQVFYKYTSSREEDETISRHSIELAMNQWTSFWIVEEAIFFTVITIIILMFNGEWFIVLLLTLMVCIGVILMRSFYKMCTRYAEDQIMEILENTTWKREIMEKINEILS